MNSKIKGSIYGLFSAAFYGMNPLFTLPLYTAGMTTNSVLFWRYLLALPILAIMVRMRGQSLKIGRRLIFPLIALGLLMGYSSLALFLSYRYMDAGIASSLLFVYPLMVALIMTFFFHEKLTFQTILCLIMACGGIYMLYSGDSSGSTLSAAGTLLVMSSSLSYAIYIVCVNFPVIRQIPTIVLTFYVIASGWLIFGASALIEGNLDIPSSPLLWIITIALALLPTVVSLILTTMSIQTIGSTATAILGVFEPVTALVFGVLVFGERLSVSDIIGLILILVAVCTVIGGENVSHHLLRIKKLFPKRGHSH
ncbi:MAG: DMT family transporter [Muribaculaceae bacterium]|nr:DMT family transporter [Muribaculaceae bacterium]MDE5857683.1 DMT family transporter [Muribaculaceae bacterium]MDE7154908.1 DMT family transporter [Muribaculaceae bacterium]MDE7368543.1 DMT family transporter [Muribaculaceae bacterium]